jgi:ABC-type multidrug transport system fused ATPase/permease subunit
MSEKTDSNKPSSILSILIKIFKTIESRRKGQFFVLIIGMVCVAVLEVLSLAAIAFFATSVSSPETVLESAYIAQIKQWFSCDFLYNIEGIIISLSVIVFLLVSIKDTFSAIILYWSSRFSVTIQGFFGEYLLHHLLHAPYEWHINENPSDLINAVQWRAYFGNYIRSLMQLISDFLIVFIMLLTLIIIKPIITTMVLLVLGLSSFLIITAVKNKLDREAESVKNYNRKCFKSAAKSIHAIKDIKIFGKQSFFHEFFKKNVYLLSRLIGRQSLLSQLPVKILEATGFFMLSLTIIVMIFFLQSTRINIFTTLSLLAVTAWRIIPAINRILQGFTQLRITIPFIERVFSYIDETEIILENKEKEYGKKNIFENEFSLNNIDFKYAIKKEKAVDDFSCTIKRGESAGIIGHSGAGKSTLVDIIIGLLRPQSGTISIDGSEMRPADWKRWQSIIGYVPQFPYIFDGTLAQNIAFGIPEEKINREHVVSVCKMASMEFLDELPEHIDTVIGERGIRLSGGQRQRVAIARALYHEPEVMIFDEATSSLDTKSEKEIQKTIYSFKGKQTLIIISHRFSTVKDCDYLIWLEKGRLVLIGKPDEIIAEYSKVR